MLFYLSVLLLQLKQIGKTNGWRISSPKQTLMLKPWTWLLRLSLPRGGHILDISWTERGVESDLWLI